MVSMEMVLYRAKEEPVCSRTSSWFQVLMRSTPVMMA